MMRLAVVKEDIGPLAERMFVKVPEGVGAGDAVAYRNALACIPDAQKIGVVEEIWTVEAAKAVYGKLSDSMVTVGEALRWWPGEHAKDVRWEK